MKATRFSNFADKIVTKVMIPNKNNGNIFKVTDASKILNI